jgi:hypothetical protein
MELIQIIRNQKLSNFNYKLSDFISEADEDEEVTKKDAFAGMTKAKNPSKKYWYVKDGEYRARVDPPKEGGWELANKKKAEKASQEKDTDASADDEVRDNINAEMAALDLNPHPEDEDSFVDGDGNEIFQIGADGELTGGAGIGDLKSAEGKPYADYIDDLNKRLYGDDDPAEKDDEDEEDGTKDEPEDKETIKKISNSLPESIRKADPSIARALHYGYNKVPATPPARAGEIWTPAPGNASSLFNETVSMIGAELLKENPEMSKEELEEKLYESLSGTDAWKGVKDKHIDTTIDAAITKHNMTREAMEAAGIEPKDAKTKSYYGTAESLQNQYDDIMEHEGPFYGGNGQEIESIPTDTETRMFMENFKDPDTGEKLSEEAIDNMLNNPDDPEVIQRFLALSAYNGGGGGNPSDTATIITDPKGNKMQFIAFSDKTSLGDQQANSTPNQLINNFYGTMRILEGDGYQIDPKEKKKMDGIIKDQGQKFKDAEKNLGKAQSAPFNVLAKLLSDPDNKEAKKIFDEAYDPPDSKRYEDIKKLHDTLNEDPDSLTDPKKVGSGVGKKLEAMKEAGIDPLPTWGYYLEQVGWKEGQEITPELTEAAYIARAGDSREFEIVDPDTGEKEPMSVGDALTSGQQQRYIAEAIKGLREAAKDGEIELKDDDRKAVVGQQRQIEKYRQESIDALNDMHDDLNEFTVKNENGEESRMGDTLMAMDMARALHLGMIDDNAPGLFSSGSVHIVAGKHRTSPKAMRECLGGIDNTDDLVRNTKTRPVEQSGPQIKGSGLYESEVSRSTKEKVTNDAGENLYIVDGRYVFSASKPKGAKDSLGVITGRKVFAYTVDAEGKEIPIGEMSMRTKGGTTLQTTYTFANDLKKCLEKKSVPTNELFNALLGNILSEEKINTLAHHWKIAEDNYPVHYFIREINEGSLN